MNIRIAIADDHPLVLSGLQHILESRADYTLTGCYTNGVELMIGLLHTQPDVLLLDIQMPGKTGDILAKEIAERYPNIRIFALTNQGEPYYVNAMLGNGVKGYLLKTADTQTLLRAINAVYANEMFVDASLQTHVAGKPGDEVAQPSVVVLSRREKEVLKYIAANLTSQQIAESMNLSKRTIDTHRQSLLDKLDVKNAAALIKKAIQMGLVA